jgi:hypothetical protein
MFPQEHVPIGGNRGQSPRKTDTEFCSIPYILLGIDQSLPSDRRAIISSHGATPMTSEEQEHLLNLVKQIEVENDRRKFLQLVAELNDLLDGKAHRLEQPISTPNTKLQQEPV